MHVGDRTSSMGMCAMHGFGRPRKSTDVCHSKAGDSPAGVFHPPPGQRLHDSECWPAVRKLEGQPKPASIFLFLAAQINKGLDSALVIDID